MTIYKCSIIVEHEGNAWNFACSIYENLRKRKNGDKFELNPLKIKKFRDGEIKTKIRDNVRRKNCFFIHDSSKMPSEWFLELALVNQTLRNSSAQEITDVLPYLKFARQDTKDESRVPVTTKVLADMIQKYADRVLTLDVHNPAIQGAYNIPFDNLYSFPITIEYIRDKYPEILENLVVMSPDPGGVKRARSFEERIQAQGIAIGDKMRPEPGEVEKIRITGDVKDKNVIIVDDILDSGKTLVKAYDSLKEEGAKKVYASCPHALFTLGIEELVKRFDLILIGDTIINPKRRWHEKIKTISFAPLFAEAIYRVNEGESLSELFE